MFWQKKIERFYPIRYSDRYPSFAFFPFDLTRKKLITLVDLSRLYEQKVDSVSRSSRSDDFARCLRQT